MAMVPPPDIATLSSSEKDALMTELLQRMQMLEQENAALKAENAALREKLNKPTKTPKNSSRPPSQGQKSNASGKFKPKRKAHPGAHRPLHPNPNRKVDCRSERCSHCQADLSGVHQAALHAYDHIEIPPIEPDVTRVTLHGGVCPCCAKAFRAEPPADLAPGSPFGPNLVAWVLYLRFTHAISFERLARLLLDLFGLEISEGALVNMLKSSRAAFAAQTALIRERLLSGTVLQSDETGMRVTKATWWMWVFHHGDSACFFIRPSRSKAVVREFLEDYQPDFWVSDRYSAQMGWAKKEHQVCLAHLLRDANYANDAGDASFAPALRDLLLEAIAVGRRRERLKVTTLKAYAAKLERKLDQLLSVVPDCDQGAKLQRAIKKYRQHLFVFITQRELPSTNNGSEQALRPGVTYRKVTNGFRSEWGADHYADVRSILETARRRGIGLLAAIRQTLAGAPLAAVR